MSLKNIWNLTLLIGVVASAPGTAVAFGPGEAAARLTASSAGRPAAGNADFKVLVWYRRADPLATFNYQIYDLRKGEYTPAVDAWISNVHVKYPAYTAFTRDVDLGVEQGKTEKLKVGSVIKRELTVAAALSGVILGQPINSSARPFESLGTLNPRVNRQTDAFSADRRFLNATPPTFPVPMPYPRPHP